MTLQTVTSSAPPLLRPSVSAPPAPVERLGWWLMPAHFLLGLALLQSYFTPTSPSGLDFLKSAVLDRSSVAWVCAGLATSTLAVAPIRSGVRREPHKGVRIVLSFFGWGYVNLLACALLHGLGSSDPVGFMLLAGVFGVPAAVGSTLPFALAGTPLIYMARRLREGVALDDRDELLRGVGLHALGAVGMVLLYVGATGGGLLHTIIGVSATALVGAWGLGLVLATTLRISARHRFVREVERGAVVDYAVVPGSATEDVPRLCRESLQRSVLVHVARDTPGSAYREGQLYAPVAAL